MSEGHSERLGAWESPITSQMVARSGSSSRGALSEVLNVGRRVYWRQLLADQGGRYSILTLGDGAELIELLPRDFNARTLVHEYGGGSYCVAGQTVYFTNYSDQRIYRQRPGAVPAAVTPAPPRPRAERYADYRVSPDRKLLFSVRERHTASEGVHNDLVLIGLGDWQGVEVVAAGHDFYSNPRWSPDGQRVSWLCWDHPDMPWDSTELWVADFDGSEFKNPRRIAGGRGVSIFQPSWSPDGDLYYVSDQTNWWNLYRHSEGGPIAVWPVQAEFGSPQWVFGLSHYGFLSDGRIACIAIEQGLDRLIIIDTRTGDASRLDLPFTAYYSAHLRTDGRSQVWFLASSPNQPQALYRYETGSGDLDQLTAPPAPAVPSEFISLPETIEFETSGGEQAHAIFYPPRGRPEAAKVDSELPPLIVSVHGGPTSAAKVQFHLETLYFTSRGFAFVDVNYRGSTGYGRRYREALNKNWGIADVEDCLAVAAHLARAGLVDPHRQAIRGGSAGGYTTLCALAFHDEFDAGTSYYGVAEPAALAEHTHKFEAHYLDRLIAPLPQGRMIYRQRSPYHHAASISCPTLLLQGDEDPVVPLAQAVEMALALEESGAPYALLVLEGESHGFRSEENIVRALETELAFYRAVFGIQDLPTDAGFEIRNLDTGGA